MTSIGSLSYAITADTSQLNQAAVLSRQEMREVRRVMEETKAPAERLQEGLDRLQKIFEAGKISAAQYEAASKNLHARTPEAVAAAAAAEARHNAILRDAKRFTDAAETADEKRVRTLHQLDAALKHGAISQETYNRTQKSLQGPNRLGSVASGALGGLPGGGMVGELVGAGAAAGPAGVAIAAGIAVATVAIGGTIAAIREMNAGMRETDVIADAAKKLSMSFRDLNTSRLSLSQTSGLDTGTIDNSLQRMQIGLAEANTTKQGGVHDAMQALGLDAGELLKKGPLEALKEISAATQQLQNPTDQLVIAYELFGKQGAALVSSLRDGPEEIERMAKLADDLGMNLSDAQAEQVGAANDAWEEMSMIATGFFRQVGAEFAPVMTVIFSTVRDMGVEYSGWKDYLTTAVDVTVVLAGNIYDVYEVSTLTRNMLAKIAALDFSGAGEDFKNAMDFGTGERNLAAVKEARQKAKEAADENKKRAEEGKGNASALEQLERQKEAEKELEANRKASAAAAKQERESELNRIRSDRDAAQFAADKLNLGEQEALKRKYDATLNAETKPPETDQQLVESALRAAAELELAKKNEKERTDLEKERTQREQKDHEKRISNAEELNKKYTKDYEVSQRLAEVEELRKNNLIDDDQQKNFRDKILTEQAKKEAARADLGPSATKGSAEEYNIARAAENNKLDAQLIEQQKQTIAVEANKTELVEIRKALEKLKIMKAR